MVGIDIGSKTIKIVELQKENEAFSLVASGIVGYSGLTIDKMNDEKDMTAIAQIIKKLHAETGATSKDVAISLPEPQVFTRTIKFPLLTDSEIASAVKWEAEQYIPIPLNEAIIQHTILSRNEKSVPPEVMVLLVAAPRSVVDKYTKIISLAGLNTIRVETELIALTRSLAPPGKTVLIADLGAGSTDIAIAANGLLSFTRTIPIAGEALSRAVSQSLNVAFPQAEEYKKTYGLSAGQLEGKVQSSLTPIIRLIVDELKKASSYYQSEQKGEAPSALIVSGGGSGLPNLIVNLSQMSGMEVLIANPFSLVRMDPETTQKLAPFAPLYSIAVGLALEE